MDGMHACMQHRHIGTRALAPQHTHTHTQSLSLSLSLSLSHTHTHTQVSVDEAVASVQAALREAGVWDDTLVW